MYQRGRARRSTTARQPLTTPSGVPIVSLVPYLPTLVAVTVAVIPQLSGHALPLEELLMASALVLVLIGRQYLTMRQNQRLTTGLTQQEAQLRHQAFHDGLTGLANRALFRNRLEHAVDLHARDLRPVSVLFLDLDDFKVVNDTLGHATGDALLVRTAERLRGAMRGGDTIARLGGDEFAVLLEDGSDPLASAARITDVLRAPSTWTVAGSTSPSASEWSSWPEPTSPRTRTSCWRGPTPQCTPPSDQARAGSSLIGRG